MKKITLYVFACLLSQVSLGQSIVKSGAAASAVVPNTTELRLNPELSIPTFMEFEKSSQVTFENWKTYFGNQFSLPAAYDFQLLSQMTDDLGFTHYRFQQTFNGIAIEYAHVIVHVKAGLVQSINGIAYRHGLNAVSGISETAALDRALNDMGATSYKWQIPAEENHLKWEQNNSEASYFPEAELVFVGLDGSVNPNQLRLCYKFNIYAHEPFGRSEYYVDAKTGEIQMNINLIHTGNVNAVANTGYSGTQPMVTDSFGDGLFRLQETTRGLGVFTYDMNRSTSHAQAIDFIDSNNVWNNFNANQDQFASDAHWGAEVMYDYMDSIHNRNSIDGNGFALRSYVHYGNNYNNAFWDGQRMTYGDGNSTTNPLTSLDIAGHEIAHGLTNFTAALIYRKESGALNESFSDIFGAAVEHHGKPAVSNWLLGEDIGSAFRNMANPNQYGDPDTYDGTNWISQNCSPTSGNDWCGVHTNSGVQNFWFYLLSTGGTGTNDKGDVFAVNSIGIVQASRVAYRNLTVYLTPTSNFDDARFYGIRSAIDLFGGCTPEVESTTNAWYAVGVGGAYTPGVTAQFAAIFDSVYCSIPAFVNFTSNSNNVSGFRWEFGDGDTSDLPKPMHRYDSAGLYTVKLFVDGGVCGADTIIKTSYISVDTNNLCSYSMDRNTTKLLTDCNARLYDNGGLNGNYEIKGQDTAIIYAANADWLELIFDTLIIESGYGGNCNHDYLEIFDGASTDARSLGRYCSANAPDTIRTSTPYVTLVMLSDDLASRAGFIMNWACQNSSQVPQALFMAKFDTTCTGYNQFYDQSQGGVSSWLWSFGDGSTSTEQNPSHEYQTNGNFTVSLTVSNSIGASGTVSKQVFINRPAAPVTTNDTNCVNANFKLAATGAGSLNWFANATGNQLVHTGDTLRLNALAADSSFYVSSTIVGPRVIGTPIFISGSGAQSDTTAEMYFDVYKPTLIESVILRSNRRGDRRIDLKNSRGEIIDSRLINVPNVAAQITLNFEVAPGAGYSLSIGNRNPSAYVNTTGAAYPYNLSNFLSITGSSLGSSAYPFFYYFTAREIACVSPRAIVEAIVDTSCIITAVDERTQLAEAVEVFPVPSFNQVKVKIPAGLEIPEARLYDMQGRAVLAPMQQVANSLQISLGDQSAGIYFLKLKFDDRIITRKIIKSSH